MPPQIALLGCVAFILLALAVHSKARPDVSRALWVPSIWMALLASRPVTLLLNPQVSPREAEVGSLEMVTFSLLIGASVVILQTRNWNWSGALRQNRALLVFAVYVGFSVLWADSPFVAFKRYVKFIGMILVAFVVLTERTPAEAIKAMARRIAYVLIPLSVLWIKYYPAFGVRYDEWTGYPMFTGVTTHKNSLGLLAMTLGLILVWALFQGIPRRAPRASRFQFVLDCFMLLLALHLLRISDSKTALVGFLVGVTLFLAQGLSFVRARAGVCIVLTAATLVMLQWGFGIYESLVELLGRNPTLTNRTQIWQELLALARNPLFGSGYESFWTDRIRQRLMEAGLGAGVSHNGFLEIYLNLGLIGLSLYVLFLAAAHANCKLWVRSDFSFGRFAYTLFVVIVLYHMTETPKGLSLILLMLYLVGLRASVHPVALGAARRVPAAGRGHSPALVFGRSDDG